ncbi:hypothetical protein FRC10_001794 [Ceratobasidium sp. 414]|nr:hypothetical protein FRC10_001794 [Ceratobasidium sp. 414]
MPTLPSLEPSAVNHRIHSIALEPKTSGWLVDLKVFVNEVEVHSLPTVKKGQSLSWDEVLDYDVWKGSMISIQFHKTPNSTWYNKVREFLHGDKPHVIPAQYEVWDTRDKHEQVIKPEVQSEKYTVTIIWTTRLLGGEKTGEFLESVLRDVAEVERHVMGNKRFQTTPNAIKEFIRFGGTKSEDRHHGRKGKTGFHRIVGLINKVRIMWGLK